MSLLFKVAVRKSLFENVELQLLAELSSVRGMCSGTAPAQINLMFWGECVDIGHCTGVNTWYSQILAYVLGYMTQIIIFTVYCHLIK